MCIRDRVRNAYVDDLPEREKVARQNYQKAAAERMEKATTLEEKLDPFGAESGRMSTNLNNKIVAYDGRNMEIKSTVERMDDLKRCV